MGGEEHQEVGSTGSLGAYVCVCVCVCVCVRVYMGRNRGRYFCLEPEAVRPLSVRLSVNCMSSGEAS